MSQKKRGLGRGLGALIPSGPENDRPVDVFFPTGDRSLGGVATAVVDPGSDEPSTGEGPTDGVQALGEGAIRGRGRTASWDSAIAGGRLNIRSGAVDGARGGDYGASKQDQDVEPLPESAGPATSSVTVLTGDAATSPFNGDVLDEDPAQGSVSLGYITSISVDTDLVDAAVSVPQESRSVEASGDHPEGVAAGDSPAGDEPDDVSRETDLVPVPGAHFAEIPTESIRPNTWQPRTVFDESELDELIASISEIGVLQPIVVRPDPQQDGEYELIMGERRWRAAQAAGLDVIPAIVRNTEDSDMLRDALLENLHRASLNPLEEAAAYRQLLDDFGCTHDELATRIARSRPQISNTLRLLKLPPLVQRRVAAGVLSAGHARALLGLTDGAEIERLAQRIVSEGLSVRATEEIVTLLISGDAGARSRRAPRAGQRSEAMEDLATRLADRFETRVKVSLGKTKGRVTVEFASVEDLNRIVAVMAPEDPGLLRN